MTSTTDRLLLDICGSSLVSLLFLAKVTLILELLVPGSFMCLRMARHCYLGTYIWLPYSFLLLVFGQP